MAKVAFFDNDILLKLAEYDLLRDACYLIGVRPSDVVVLHGARPWLERRMERKLRKPSGPATAAGIARALGFVAHAQPLTDVGDRASLDRLTSIDDIDPGEAQLIVAAARSPQAILATGDKRCLRALAGSREAREVFHSLAGRVVCLEEIIRALLEHKGYPHVSRAIAQSPDCDRLMCRIFYDGAMLPSQAVVDVESSLENLRRDLGEGWLMRL